MMTEFLRDSLPTAVSSSNPLPTSQPDGLAVSGSVTSAAVLFTTSMIGYEGLTLQVTSAGTSCTITYEASEDQTTWYPTAVMSASVLGSSNSLLSFASTTSTALLQLYTQRRGSYFRARVSTYGSGTVSIQGVLTKTCPTLFVDARLTGYAGEGATISGTAPPAALEARTTTKTTVTSGQSVRKIGTVDGRQIVLLNSIPENEWRYAAASGGITNTTDVVLAAVAGSGIKNYLTAITLQNASATATEFVIKDGAAPIWRITLPANMSPTPFPFPTPLQSTANTALNAACTTTGTATYVNAQGYKAP